MRLVLEQSEIDDYLARLPLSTRKAWGIETPHTKVAEVVYGCSCIVCSTFKKRWVSK